MTRRSLFPMIASALAAAPLIRKLPMIGDMRLCATCGQFFHSHMGDINKLITFRLSRCGDEGIFTLGGSWTYGTRQLIVADCCRCAQVRRELTDQRTAIDECLKRKGMWRFPGGIFVDCPWNHPENRRKGFYYY